MSNDPTEAVYRRLARHLDDLPGGFPATDSGVELRILRRLFTPEEASLAIHVTILPETPPAIARRAGLAPEVAAVALETMARNGLVYRLRRRDRILYHANQYVIGIWEFQVNRLDPDLIRDMNEYIPTLFEPETWRKAPQLRTIPVAESIPHAGGILPYEDARQVIQAHRRIVVAPCICRREHRMMGRGCDKPEETCLVFGAAADYYAENGLGRYIDIEEALGILQLAEAAGLVLQPGASQRPGNICCCCGCCCQVLKAYKRHPHPASIVSSAFTVALEADECIGCGACVDRCQMDAIRMEDGCAVVDLDRCIGCGLCVTACPTKCLRLERKPAHLEPDVPVDTLTAYMRLAKARGRLLPLASQGIRSLLGRATTRD